MRDTGRRSHISFSSESEALDILREALKKEPLDAFSQFESVAHAIRIDVIGSKFGGKQEFEHTPKLMIIFFFMTDWQWFSNFGIEPADFLDVIKGGLEFLKKIIDADYNYLLSDPRSDEEKYNDHQQLPGYQEWLGHARKRFQEISHTPKYIGGWDTDPMGL